MECRLVIYKRVTRKGLSENILCARCRVGGGKGPLTTLLGSDILEKGIPGKGHSKHSDPEA